MIADICIPGSFIRFRLGTDDGAAEIFRAAGGLEKLRLWRSIRFSRVRKHSSGISKVSGRELLITDRIFGARFAYGDPHAVPDYLRDTHWL